MLPLPMMLTRVISSSWVSWLLLHLGLLNNGCRDKCSLQGCAHGLPVARRRPARRLGAAGGRARAAAGGARLPAAPRRRPHPLRVLRARDALRGPGPDAADDAPGAADQRHAAPALPRGQPARGPRAGGAVPLPRGQAGDQRPAHRGRLGQGAGDRAWPRDDGPPARHRRSDRRAGGAARRDRGGDPGAARPPRAGWSSAVTTDRHARAPVTPPTSRAAPGGREGPRAPARRPVHAARRSRPSRSCASRRRPGRPTSTPR